MQICVLYTYTGSSFAEIEELKGIIGIISTRTLLISCARKQKRDLRRRCETVGS